MVDAVKAAGAFPLAETSSSGCAVRKSAPMLVRNSGLMTLLVRNLVRCETRSFAPILHLLEAVQSRCETRAQHHGQAKLISHHGGQHEGG